MTQLTEDFAGISDGTNITDANTAFDTMYTTGNLKADDGDIMSAKSGTIYCLVNSTSQTAALEENFTADADAGVRLYGNFDGNAPPTFYLFGGGSGNSTDLEVRVNSARTVTIRTNFIARSTSTATLPSTGWWSVDVYTDGTTFTCELYTSSGGDGTNPDETLNTTTSVPSTISKMAFGSKTSATITNFGIDDITLVYAESLPARGLSITPGLASQLVTTYNPTDLSAGLTLKPDLALLDLYDDTYSDVYPGGARSFGPEASTSSGLLPGLASQVAVSYDPSVGITQVFITPTLETQTVGSFAPLVESTESFIAPALTEMLIVGFAPTVTGEGLTILAAETGTFFRHQPSTRLALVFGAARSATTGYSGSEGWEKVSGPFRFQWDTRTQVFATVLSAWDANKTDTASTLAAALDLALNNAGYRAPDGTAVEYDAPVGTMT